MGNQQQGAAKTESKEERKSIKSPRLSLRKARNPTPTPTHTPTTSGSSRCFFGNISRAEGKAILLSEPPGTYLVRRSEQNSDELVLSCHHDGNERPILVHFRIKLTKKGTYYISKTIDFETLNDLIKYYEKRSDILGLQLTKPCIKPKPPLWDLDHTHVRNWEIPKSGIKLISKLGEGNFGEVYYGKWKNTYEVAVKTLKPGKMSNEKFLEEAAIMKTIRHKNIVVLYGVSSKEEPIYIIQEYMSKGSLLGFLRSDENTNLKVENLIYIVFQVASGMDYLESKQLVHRDLAARNVLLMEKNVVKICDFGLARMLTDNEYLIQNFKTFPIKWTAPEVINKNKYTIKSDVWSYGIFLMVVFTYGAIPYAGIDKNILLKKLDNGYRMPKPTQYQLPDKIYKIMLKCWDAKPDNRPTFKFLTQFFGNFKYEDDYTHKIYYRNAPSSKLEYGYYT